MAKSSVREALKARTKESAKSKDSGGSFGKSIFKMKDLPEKVFWKPEEGWNKIDIIPYLAGKNHPSLEVGQPAYVLDVWVHKGIGAADDAFLCLKKNFGKPCPICEELERQRKDGVDDEDLKELKASRRCIYNVIDKNGDDEDVHIFEVSHFLFEKELIEESENGDDGEYIVFSDLEDGRTIKFKGVEEKFKGRKFTKIKKISFVERDEAYDEDIMEQTYTLDELLHIPTYEEILNSFMNRASEKEDDDDEDEDEKPTKKGKAKVVEDDDDDEDEKPVKKGKAKPSKDDDDDEDEKPVKKGKAKPSKDDDDDEEDDEKPVKKGKLKAGECPADGVFGEDCDEHDDCEDCTNHKACAAAEDAKKKPAKKGKAKPSKDDDDDEDD
jgi:hypothetical protein